MPSSTGYGDVSRSPESQGVQPVTLLTLTDPDDIRTHLPDYAGTGEISRTDAYKRAITPDEDSDSDSGTLNSTPPLGREEPPSRMSFDRADVIWKLLCSLPDHVIVESVSDTNETVFSEIPAIEAFGDTIIAKPVNKDALTDSSTEFTFTDVKPLINLYALTLQLMRYQRDLSDLVVSDAPPSGVDRVERKCTQCRRELAGKETYGLLTDPLTVPANRVRVLIPNVDADEHGLL